jgi:hypothetical protein
MHMTQVPPQSDAEIRHICDEWVRNFAPTVAPRLILNGKNFEKISQRCFQKGYVSITYLTESYNELSAAGALELTPEPRALTAQERFDIEAKKTQDRMDRDYLDSIKKQPVYDPKKVEQTAENEKWIKSQTTARNELNTIITEYETYNRPNSVDHGMGDAVRVQLRKISVPAPAGKAIDASGTDYIATVQWVRAIKADLPDHPTNAWADVHAALERVKARFLAEREKRSKPDRNQGW